MMRELHEKYLKSEELPFCPGCGNGIFINCLLQAFEELGIDFHKTIFVSGIGCAAWIPNPHFKAETMHTTHGRPIAFATGIKLSLPDRKVVIISGDGDLTTIGGNHLIHGVRRNTPMTVICINNFLYGMTGGQVGATTPLGARTSTTSEGNQEKPFDLIKLVLGAGASNASRLPLVWPRLVIEGLKKALIRGDKEFTFVEIVSPCITHYGRKNEMLTPGRMLLWQKEKYVSKEVAQKSAAERLKGKIIFGEFTDLREYLKLEEKTS